VTATSTSGAGWPGLGAGPKPRPDGAPPLRWPGSYLQLVSVRTWRTTGHLLLDLVAGSISFSIVVSLLATLLGVAIVVPVGLLVAAVTLWTVRGIAVIERARVRALLDVDIARPAPLTAGGTWFRRFGRAWLDGSTWRAIIHSLVLFPLGLFTFITTLLVWCVPLTLLSLPATIYLLPGHEVRPGLHQFRGEVSGGIGGALGLVLIGLVPFAIRALGDLDVAVARALLGPGRRAALDERVATLETRRAAVVDEAEAERRRIERDLHDGAQQRLVALALDLGLAQQKLDSDPAEARALIDDAHREAKQALVEMRDLVRGIHPAVLADRGLGAALSSVVARTPVPVDLDVRIDRRPDERAEAIAYFVVCESLVNIGRHSGATRALVSVVRHGDTLVVHVSDNGHGGADPTGGTGLSGLRARVEGVDGRFTVSSPPLGPTVITAEVPCAS